MIRSVSWHKVQSLPLVVVVLITVSDQWTKYLVIHSEILMAGGHFEIIPGLFSIVFVGNTGAAWGMFAGKSVFLGIISLVVLVLVSYYFREVTEGFRSRCIAISLVLGGICGNLIDRFCRRFVVDFLSFTYDSLEWPAFNIADSAICIGVVIYTWSTFTASSVPFSKDDQPFDRSD